MKTVLLSLLLLASLSVPVGAAPPVAAAKLRPRERAVRAAVKVLDHHSGKLQLLGLATLGGGAMAQMGAPGKVSTTMILAGTALLLTGAGADRLAGLLKKTESYRRQLE